MDDLRTRDVRFSLILFFPLCSFLLSPLIAFFLLIFFLWLFKKFSVHVLIPFAIGWGIWMWISFSPTPLASVPEVMIEDYEIVGSQSWTLGNDGWSLVQGEEEERGSSFRLYQPLGVQKIAHRYIKKKLSSLKPLHGLAYALVLGERSDLGIRVGRWYQSHGLGYLLALSGFHVGFYFWVFNVLFKKRLSPLPTISFLLLLLWIIGPIPSFLRATLMFGYSLMLRLLGVQKPIIPALVLSFVTQSLFFQDFGPGFWLSYGAITALVFQPSIKLAQRKKIVSSIFSITKLSSI